MPAFLKHTASTGGTYAATVQRLSDGAWFTPSNSSYAASPLYSSKRIPLPEGANELVGSYTATVSGLSGVNNANEPGLVRIRIHDESAANRTILTEDFFVYQGNLVRSDVPVASRATSGDIGSAVASALTDPNTGILLDELTSLPPASPTVGQMLMLIYMAARNKGAATDTVHRIFNDAGLPVLEADVSDDGVTFNRTKLRNVIV